jgi:hypothetical protein
MAVTSDISSISYTGNNSTTTSYAVPFLFLENGHLSAVAKVTATGVETVVTLTNHTGAGDPNGGTVRAAVAVPATSTLTIFRTVPATQTTSYAEGGDFPAASHERALDKLTFLSQQNERAVERSFRVTEGSGTKNEVVAVPNTLLGLDASNQPKALTVDQVKSLLAITGVTLDVQAGIKTFADAGERALAVPDFAGQLGTQRDTADIYISIGTTAGDWALVDENMSLADFAAGLFTADATGRGKFASGFVDAGLIATDAVETAKIKDAAVTTAKIANAAVTPVKLSQPYTLATSVVSTGVSFIDYTGIPSWAKRITVILNGVSLNGTADLLIQIGSGSFATSGYGSWSNFLAGSVSSVSTGSTSGFIVYMGSAASIATALVRINLLTGNTWVADGVGAYSNNGSQLFTAGSVALSGTLDRVRIVRSNATDTFDAGTINISYEG